MNLLSADASMATSSSALNACVELETRMKRRKTAGSPSTLTCGAYHCMSRLSNQLASMNDTALAGVATVHRGGAGGGSALMATFIR